MFWPILTYSKEIGFYFIYFVIYYRSSEPSFSPVPSTPNVSFWFSGQVHRLWLCIRQFYLTWFTCWSQMYSRALLFCFGCFEFFYYDFHSKPISIDGTVRDRLLRNFRAIRALYRLIGSFCWITDSITDLYTVASTFTPACFVPTYLNYVRILIQS